MSTVAFIRRMLDAGFTHDDALRAAEAFEATASEMLPVEPARSKGAERQARYRERHQASQNVTSNASDDNPLPLPSSPQTPQQPTPTPGEILPARKGLAQVELARGFTAFWTAYPRKKSKDDAVKAFAKAMNRITEDDPLSVILAGIERALPGWDEPQFIPYPASWLNAAGWEDEAPPPPSPRPGPRHDRPDHRTAKSDHLSAVARAMAAACDGAEREHCPDRPDPGSGEPMLIGHATA